MKLSKAVTRRVLASLTLCITSMQLVVAQAAPPPPPPASSAGSGSMTNLDFSSTVGSSNISALGARSVTIHNGQTAQIVNSQTMLTPAQQAAVYQILNTGHQAIQLGALGNAIGGNVAIGSWLSGAASNLVIPKGLSALETNSVLKIDGVLNNGGTLNLVPTAGNLSTIDVSTIINSGLINAAGNLTIVSDNAISINNAGGTIKALGAVNVNGAALDIRGGSVLSDSFNINVGCGEAKIGVNNISGLVNITAGIAHLLSSTANLRLGSITISGDPLFDNQGNIQISGPISTSGGPLAIIASGNITSTVGASIDTSNSGGTSGDVLMIAGAAFTGGSGSGNTSTPDPSTITVTGGSVSGGSINLSTGSTTGTSINTAGNNNSGATPVNGGNLTLVAFAGANIGSGAINTLNSPITTGGAGTSAAPQVTSGDVVMIAGAPSGTGISAGSINTSGTGIGEQGQVYLLSAAPTITTPLVIDAGTVQYGEFTLTQIRNTDTLVSGAIQTNTAPVVITTGGNVLLQAPITTNGGTLIGTPGDLIIYAGGNITALNSSANLSTAAPPSFPTGTSAQQVNGADMILLAGANIDLAGTTFAPQLFPPPPPTPNPAIAEAISFKSTILGASRTGGSIDLSKTSALNTSGTSFDSKQSNGGNVLIGAFASPNGEGGIVNLEGVAITTGGQSYITSTVTELATNGNVTVYGGGIGTSIRLDDISTVGSSTGGITATNQSSGAGSVIVATAQPSGALPITFDFTNSTTTLPLPAVDSGPLVNSSIVIGSIATAGGQSAPGGSPLVTAVDVQAGKDLTIGSVSNDSNTLYQVITTTLVVSQPSSTINLSAGGVMNLTGGESITSNATQNATPVTGTSGGTITLSAGQFNIIKGQGTSPNGVAIAANGTSGYFSGDNTGGNGGIISITTTGNTAASTVNIGDPLNNNINYFTVAAIGDSTGGNGGQLTVNAGGSVNVDTGSMQLGPSPGVNNISGNPAGVSSGRGAVISLTARTLDSTGQCLTGCVYSNGTLNANGSASAFNGTTGNPGGDGGIISISTNSKLAFDIGGAGETKPNGIASDSSTCKGCLVANGNVTSGTNTAALGAGGSISVSNLGGGITIANTGTNTNVPGATASIQVQSSNATGVFHGADGGSIKLQANGAILSKGGIDASGGTAAADQPPGNGGSIEIDSNSTTVFEVGTPTTAQTNGVIGSVTAYGFIPGSTTPTTVSPNPLPTNYGDGGTVILGNIGTGGIRIGQGATAGTAAVAVDAMNSNAEANLNGGDGGTIKLYAPNGNVFVNASLSANGGNQTIAQGTSTSVSGTVSSIVVSNPTSFQEGQTAWLTGTTGGNSTFVQVTIGTISGTTVNFSPSTSIAWDNTTATLNAYYQAGNGGTIDITANSGTSTTNIFNVGTTATTPTSGINGTLSVTGYNGGTISVNNSGKSGIQVQTGGIVTVTTLADTSTVITSLVSQGGNGANIAVQAPNGPVSIADSLHADGVSGVTGGAFGANVGGNGGNLLITSNSAKPFTIGLGTGSMPVNGVQTSLTANAGGGNTQNGNAGSIAVNNLGLGGISVGSSTTPCTVCLTVSANPTIVNVNNNPISGNGGSLALNSPNGPVSLFGNLNANGGTGFTGTAGIRPAGLAGSISIVSNNGTTTPLTLNNGQLSANGWNGGTISVVNNGTKGILVNSGAISVTASDFVIDSNAMINGQPNPNVNLVLAAGGAGGNISLSAPNGPVAFGSGATLNVDGGNGSVVTTAIGWTISANTAPGYGPWTISGGSASTPGTFYPGAQIVIVSTDGTVKDYQNVGVFSASPAVTGPTSTSIQVYSLSQPWANGESVNLASVVPGGAGGQIAILQKNGSAITLGGTGNPTFSASAGTSGGNGGKITFTNTGAGTINVAGANAFNVAPSAANEYASGGNGGALYLNAIGTNGKIVVSQSLNVDGGAAYPLDTNNFSSDGGSGGKIAITTNSTTTFNVGTAGTNGITGTLSAAGANGGTIGIKNFASGGVTLNPSNILVTASGSVDGISLGNGGNIDIEAPATTAAITVGANGTLSADAATIAGASGGKIALAAGKIVFGSNSLMLSAMGDTSGLAGSISVSQFSTTAPILTVGGSALQLNVGGMDGGYVLLSSANNIVIDNTNGVVTPATGTVQIQLTGKGTLTGDGINTGSLRLDMGTGAVGSSATPFSVQAADLFMITRGGSVFITDGTAVNVSGSQTVGGSTSIVSTGGDITVSDTLKSVGNITLNSQTGNVVVAGNLLSHGLLTLDAFTGGNTSGGVSGIAGFNAVGWTGIVIKTGTGGITDLNTATGKLSIAAAGDNTTSAAISVTNTGTVAVDTTGSAFISDFTIQNLMGSLTIGATATSNSFTAITRTDSGNDSYSISLSGNVGGANASTSLLSAGSIVQSNGALISGSTITLSSQTGNIGTAPLVAPGATTPAGLTYAPINIALAAGGTLYVNVVNNAGIIDVVPSHGGSVAITNSTTGGANIGGVLSAGDFKFTNADNITVAANGGVNSRLGGVTLQQTSSSTGTIAINGNITAGGGPAVIENDFLTGSITVADGVSISGYGRVIDAPATVSVPFLTGVALTMGLLPSTPTQGTIPANVNVALNGTATTSLPASGTTVYFGSGLTSNGSSPNLVNANTLQASPYASDVVFNQGSGTITLGNTAGGVTVTSNGTVQALSNLDLSNAATRTALGQLSNAGITVSGKTITISNTVSLINLNAFNIPAGYTVNFKAFTLNDPVVVTLAKSATTSQAIIAGTANFSSNPTDASIFVNATATASDALIKISGGLNSTSDLLIAAGGKITASGKINAGSSSNLVLTSGTANLGTVATVTAGTINLTGATLTAGTISGGGLIDIKSSGSITQTSGTMIASDIAMTVGGTLFKVGSNISTVGLNADQVALYLGAGSVGSVIKQAATATINSVAFDTIDQTLTITPSTAISLSGSSYGTVAVTAAKGLTLTGPVRCGSCTMNSQTSSFTANNADISTTDPAGAITITGASVNITDSSVTSPNAISITASTGNLSIQQSSIRAGVLSSSYFDGLLSPGDITRSGGVSLTATKGSIAVGAGSELTSVGADITVRTAATTGSISLSGILRADGANISVQAGGSVVGSNPTLTAKAIGFAATNSVGGNISIGSGITATVILALPPTLPGTVSALPQFLQPDGTIAPLGRNTLINNLIGVNTPTGAITTRGTGVIDLGTTAGSTAAQPWIIPTASAVVGNLNLTGGTIVFNAANTSSIRLDGSTFTTNAYTPIAMVERKVVVITPNTQSEFATRFGTVVAKKGSVVVVESDAEKVIVYSLSKRGDVAIHAGGARIELATGEQVTVAKRAISNADQMLHDGVGRRQFGHSRAIGATGLHYAACEFSIVSMLAANNRLNIQEQKLVDAILKHAAAVETVSRRHGAYTALQAEKKSEYKAVSYGN